MTYLEQLHAKYLQYSLNKAITQSADDVITYTVTQGGQTVTRQVLGRTLPFARQIALSGKANLATLAEELIHFEQLFVRNMWGMANTAANRQALQAITPELEESVRRLLVHWGFRYFP